MTLVQMALAWGFGILLADSIHTPGSVWLLPLVISLLILAVLGRDKLLRRVGLCLLAGSLGMARYDAVQPHFTSADLATYNDRQPADLTGVIADEPELRDQNIRLRVEVESIRVGGESFAVHGLALVYADRSSPIHFRYGDKIRVYGFPQTPPEFDTFSFRDYLARGGVYTVVFRPQITFLEGGHGDPLATALFGLKEQARNVIDRVVANPQAGLLRGILVGDDSEIAPDISDAFLRTNTTHLIAISGSNISVVVALLMALFGRLKHKRLMVVLTVAGVVIYTIFVGASPSVLRAAVMGCMGLIAGRVGRRAHGLTMLAAATWGITILNPLAIFDLGLILSGMATLGLLLYQSSLTRVVERFLSRHFSSASVRQISGILSDTVLISLVAQITTLPIILLINDGQFSLMSIPVNILVAPAQPWIMNFGIPMLFAGLIAPPLGQIIGWFAALPVAYTVAIIRAGAALSPTFTITLSPLLALGYYAVLLTTTLVLMEPPKPRARWLKRFRALDLPLLAVGGAVAVLLWIMVIGRPDGLLHVWYLGVGEGNAVLIQTPAGGHILIDGGENPTRLLTALGDRLPFYKRSLDLLIITEPKTVTAAALPALLDQYTVKTAITNGQDSFSALNEALKRANTQVIAIQAGYKLQVDGDVQIECLSPVKPPTPDQKPDDAPLILKVTHKNASFLITSEITEDGIGAVTSDLKSRYWGTTVLELASNGVAKVNPKEWLDAVKPQVAVVIAEAGSRTAQPDDSVLSALGSARIYRTDRDGTIEIATDGQQLNIRTSGR